VTVDFYELGAIDDGLLAFAVVMARYRGQWIFGRHKERSTWEVPGGHREKGERIEETASRELVEESGAIGFSLLPICVYSVGDGEQKSYGQLFFAEVEALGALPPFEIAETRLFDALPERLTYPLIQTMLYDRALGALDARL
jgi:8-oxo-dGTP diphosphatase